MTLIRYVSRVDQTPVINTEADSEYASLARKTQMEIYYIREFFNPARVRNIESRIHILEGINTARLGDSRPDSLARFLQIRARPTQQATFFSSQLSEHLPANKTRRDRRPSCPWLVFFLIRIIKHSYKTTDHVRISIRPRTQTGFNSALCYIFCLRLLSCPKITKYSADIPFQYADIIAMYR